MKRRYLDYARDARDALGVLVLAHWIEQRDTLDPRAAPARRTGHIRARSEIHRTHPAD